MFGITKNPPDFVNAGGVKWWIHQELTDYASRVDHKSTPLGRFSVHVAQLPSGVKSFVLIQDGRVIKDCSDLETATTRIDMMRMMKEER